MSLTVRIAVGMVFLAMVAVAAVGILTYWNLRNAVVPLELGRLGVHVDVVASDFDIRTADVRSDLLALHGASAMQQFRDILIAVRNGVADADAVEAARDEVTTTLLAFAHNNPLYDQIRIIGVAGNGRELVRVARSTADGVVRAVPDDELQAKGSRVYFTRSIALADGEVYVSPIELYREYEVVQVPHQPVLRVGASLLADNGEPLGALIIDVDLTEILARIARSSYAGGAIYMVNGDGDFLVHPDPAMAFGFDLGARHRWSDDSRLGPLDTESSSVYTAIRVWDDEQHGVALRRVNPAGGEPVTIIGILPEESLLATARAVLRSTILVGLVATVLAVIIAYALARSLTRPLVSMTNAVKSMQTGDEIPAPVQASGEIGVLARAFETVRTDVAAKTKALEGEVEVRRQAELAAEKSAADARLLAAIVQTSHDAIVTMTLDGTITSWNPAAERLFGYGAKEAVGQSINLIVPPERQDTVRANLEKIARGVRVDLEETTRSTKDGRLVDVALTASPILSNEGKVIGASKIARDITEHRHAERMFRLAVDASPSGMVLVDQDGIIALANTETERLFGYTRGEMVGQRVEMLLPERFRAGHFGHLRNYVANPEARPMGAGRELFGLRKDGTEFPVEIGLNPVRTKQGLQVIAAITDISARKRADTELRESKERYEAIIATALDGIVVMDHHGRIVGLNHAAEVIFGHRETDVVGETLADVMIPPALREQHRRGLEHYLTTGEGPVLNRRIEVTGLRADGSIVPIELSIGRMPGAGDPLFTAFVRDITDRKNAEEKFRLAVDASPSAMVLVDRAGTIVLVNAETERLFGYARDELIGQTVEVLVPERFRRHHPGFVREFTAKPVARPMGGGRELFGRRKDGSEFPVEIGLNPVEGHEGLRIIAAITDITERKLAELALRESERRFREIAESLPQLVWTCLPDGQCDYVSHQWVDFTGRSEAEHLGSGWAEAVYPGDRERLDQAWDAAVEEGRIFECEFRIRRHDGRYRWFDARAVPLRDERGRITKWFGSNTDITERREASLALVRQADELRRSNEELAQFAYVASHDLQEPLRMVASYTELLGERYRGKLDEKADKFIHYAVDGARRMQRLVSDLLAYSRVGRTRLKIEPVNTDEVVKNVLTSLEGRIREIGAEVSCEPLPIVEGDEVQLGQIFQNLISNALKFHAEQSPRVRIGVRAEDGLVEFFVADNGIGIDMRHADRLFQMFQRLHERGRYEGSGIGLAIVKKIVTQHGGRIWFESTPGEGATFFFTLPRHQATLD